MEKTWKRNRGGEGGEGGRKKSGFDERQVQDFTKLAAHIQDLYLVYRASTFEGPERKLKIFSYPLMNSLAPHQKLDQMQKLC